MNVVQTLHLLRGGYQKRLGNVSYTARERVSRVDDPRGESNAGIGDEAYRAVAEVSERDVIVSLSGRGIVIEEYVLYLDEIIGCRIVSVQVEVEFGDLVRRVYCEIPARSPVYPDPEIARGLFVEVDVRGNGNIDYTDLAVHRSVRVSRAAVVNPVLGSVGGIGSKRHGKVRRQSDSGTVNVGTFIDVMQYQFAVAHEVYTYALGRVGGYHKLYAVGSRDHFDIRLKFAFQ